MTISNMKTNTPKHKQNGKAVTTESLIAKAVATKKLAKAAREHLKLVKAEFKEARKAFKQAKKAARRARKEAKAALKMVNGKVIKAVEKAKAPARKVEGQTARPAAARAAAKTNGGHSLTVPMISNIAPHEGTRVAAQS
jgi:hypothetical protein